MRDRRYYVGLDLGQIQEYTALVVLDRPLVKPGTPPQLRRPAYTLRHMQRFPLGTPYPEVVSTVVALLQTRRLNHSFLTIDQTGVGQAVVKMLKDSLHGNVNCHIAPVTITGGDRVMTGGGQGMQVPKKELVGVVQVLLQSRRLHIAKSLPDAAMLVRELETFKARITVGSTETFEAWRERDHDDLVLALALAAWWGESGLPPVHEPPPPRRTSWIRVR
jgi:hypothetical protein